MRQHAEGEGGGGVARGELQIDRSHQWHRRNKVLNESSVEIFVSPASNTIVMRVAKGSSSRRKGFFGTTGSIIGGFIRPLAGRLGASTRLRTHRRGAERDFKGKGEEENPRVELGNCGEWKGMGGWA